MHVVTFSPVSTSLRLKAGVDPRAEIYGDILKALPAAQADVTIPNDASARSRRSYDDLKDDGYDLRLFEWRPTSPPGSKADIRFHIYPDAVAIAQVTFHHLDATDAPGLEDEAQAKTHAAIAAHADALETLLAGVRQRLSPKFFEPGTDARAGAIAYTARAIILSDDELARPDCQALVTAWLENTARPEDAARLIAGECDASITWVNYVIVEHDPDRTRMLLSTLRIAQYFYAAQDGLNDQTQVTISRAYFLKNVREAEKMLVSARASMQMLRIEYDIQRKFLNRNKQRVLDDIMAAWEFDTLVANGGRMVEASTARLTEISEKRSQRSAFVTDMILVFIGFLAVIEVLLILTEYSREVMSRPALAYNDDRLSWVLSTIADIETDAILFSGVFSVLLLVGIYAYWKRNR